MASYCNAGTNINWNASWFKIGIANTSGTLGVSVVSGTDRYSATFNGNSTNTDKGVLFQIYSFAGTGQQITVTLQENSGGWVNRVSFTFTIASSTPNSTTSGGCWIYVEFSSTHTETNGTNNYRYKFSSNSSTDTKIIGDFSNYGAVIQILNGTASLAANDVTYISGKLASDGSNAAATVTVNINDSSTAFGSVNICPDAILEYGTTASTTYYLKAKGLNVLINGLFKVGSISTPMPASSQATLDLGCGANNQYKLNCFYGKCSIVGADMSYYKTTYSSGSGTTGSPLITANSTGWAINDKVIILTDDSDATHVETKFIKTISGTQITLSDTAGGAESGLSYTHASGNSILNLTRNCRIFSGSNSYYTGFQTLAPGVANQTDIVFKNVLFDHVQIEPQTFYNYTLNFALDYCVFDSGAYSIRLTRSSFAANQLYADTVWSNNFSYNTSGAADNFRIQYGCDKKVTLDGWFFVKTTSGILLESLPTDILVVKNTVFCGISTTAAIVCQSGAYANYIFLENNRYFACKWGIAASYGFHKIIEHNSIYGKSESGAAAGNSTGDFSIPTATKSGLFYNGYNVDFSSSTFIDGLTGLFSGKNGGIFIHRFGKTAGRSKSFMNNGFISDQITNGQSSAYAKGGSGIWLKSRSLIPMTTAQNY
ncbi:MAG: hypothetical protein HZB36_00960 [Candidatus Omnitrophica bacterium]|nr:hypothetical protein [Candidatus Omnitrophota bacterium]